MAAITERPAPQAKNVEPAVSGDRFVGIGLLVVAATFVTIQLLARAVIPPLAVPAVIYVGLGIAVLRRGARWLRILIAVLVTLHLASSAPFLAASLAHPESPAGFIPDAIAVLVGAAVVVGAIAGVRGMQNRRPIGAAAGVVAVAVVAVSLLSAAGLESAPQQAGDVAVEAERAQYPATVAVPAGGAALWVDNRDAFHHTLVIDGTDVHAEVPGSNAVRVEVDLAPGAYRYFCDVPGHEGMEGELVVN